MIHLTNPHEGLCKNNGRDGFMWRLWTPLVGLLLTLLAGVVGGCLPPANPEIPLTLPKNKPSTRLLLHPFQEIGTPTDLVKARDRIQSFLVGRSQERFGLNYLETNNAEVDPRSQSGMERLMALGITHLLTGRMKPPPNGFFLVELYEPPHTEPTWVRDIPVDSSKSLDAVVDVVMSELEERFKKDHVTVLLGREPGQSVVAAPVRLSPPERSQKDRPSDKSAPHGEVAGAPLKEAAKLPADRQLAEKGDKLALVSVQDGGGRSMLQTKPASTGRSASPERTDPPQTRHHSQYRYALQAAAAPSVQDFEKTAARIRQRGFHTSIYTARNRNGQQWYFLWVGQFVDQQKAKDAMINFRRKVRDIPVFVAPIGEEVSYERKPHLKRENSPGSRDRRG
ncbi:MAG: SPOR domain-containing protein [Magnetococcales bacterium]|nr:SPOR domain-containing protein [Magnetococcales bacterium]MBF0321883.1 SPOR domain-containing protein [Magnetococcales bacterium]